MTRAYMAASLLLGTLVLVVAAASGAAEQSWWNTLRMAQTTNESPAPKVWSPTSAEDISSPNVARLPNVTRPSVSAGEQAIPVGEQAGSRNAVSLRDPTQPSEQLRDLVAPIRMGQQAGRGGAGGISLPRIKLKGRIVGPLRPPVAIVEVDDVLYVLRQGSELTVPAPNVGLGCLTLVVSELTTAEVRIEIMPLRQVTVLR